jgi:hypothetical protein
MLDTTSRQLNVNFGAFQQGLIERGYAESQNLIFEPIKASLLDLRLIAAVLL